MFDKEVSGRQLWTFVIISLAAPLAQLVSWASWPVVLAMGCACGFVCFAVLKLSAEKTKWGKGFCALQWVWLIVVLGQLSFHAADAWPTGNTMPAVPLILLVLAAWAACGGASRACRAVCAGAWITAFFFAVVLGAGFPSVEAEHLTAGWYFPPAVGIVVFLIPCVLSVLPGQKRNCVYPIAGIVLLGAFFAVWTTGILSEEIAAQYENPFYEAGRSIRLMGSFERLEPLISAALTISWCALMALILSACGNVFSGIFAGREKAGVLIGAGLTAVLLMCKLHIPDAVLAAGSLICWVFLPIITQGIGCEKKSKKRKESA